MKRIVAYPVMLATVLVFSSQAAGAATLQITGWALFAGSAGISVYDGANTLTGLYSLGSFAARLDGTPLPGPLYCLDIFHSFSFGNTWQVQPIIVPPDPPSPPPYNTGEASWVYQNYGRGISASEGYKAAGVQLALWEISHDQDWRSGYDPNTTWWSLGNFKYNSGNTAMRQHADTILDDVFANYDPSMAGHVVYYEPLPRPGGSIYGQGQIGAIPEPSTILILGLGLIGAALRRLS